jgi:hypothetical protein
MSTLLAVRLKGDMVMPWWIVHIQEGEPMDPMCGQRTLHHWDIEWQAPLAEMPFEARADETAYNLCPLCVGVLLSRLNATAAGTWEGRQV